MIISSVPIYEINIGDNLKNGETVTDIHLNEKGYYSVTLERWDSTGACSQHTLEYPISHYMRMIII